jgi:hypothetical protein
MNADPLRCFWATTNGMMPFPLAANEMPGVMLPAQIHVGRQGQQGRGGAHGVPRPQN